MSGQQPVLGDTLDGVEYTDVAEVRGPLMVVRGVAGVGWD